MATTADKVNAVSKRIVVTKLLASNDPKTRSEGIKQIKQLLLNNSGETNDALLLGDYLMIWKGLFYFMWMSDKPLPQESATEKISNLIHSCTSYQGKVLFLEAFFLIIKDDWMSISQHRIDKFMMLVRRCLRQVLFTFVNCNWDLEYMNKFNEVLYRALKSFTLSLRTHLQEIFLEELAKVSKGKVPSEALIIILDAFLHYISELNDFMPIKEVIRFVFRNLLSQSSELEMLGAKYEAWKKMGKPGKTYNDLELVEGDIADDDSNEQNNMPLDPRAGNVNVEIPRIKFSAKDVAKLLNKYVTEVDCTRKCLVEITKLLKWYNRLSEGILPYKPKELKLNSQVLKRKKKKHLSKMIKEGIKKLEMIDSKIKKNSREVIGDHKSFKKLDKMGEIIVKHGKVGKSIWEVRKFDEHNALKENEFNLNASWTVSEETNNVDNENKTVCETIDKEAPLLVPAEFTVEDLKNSEIILSNILVQTSSPSLKSLIDNHSPKDNNLNKRESKSPKLNITDKSHNIVNTSHNDSELMSIDKDGSVSKKVKKNDESAKAEKCILTSTSTLDNTKNNRKLETSDVQNTTECSMSNNGVEKIIQLKSPKTIDKNIASPCDDFVLSKIKQHSNEMTVNSSLNTSWTVCNDENQKSNSPESKITDNSITNENNQQANSSLLKICSPNINENKNCSAFTEKNGSTSKQIKQGKKSAKVEKRSSLSTDNTPGKNSKSPKSPKSPTPEQRVLRRRTIIIPKKKPGVQNEGSTPKRKVKDNSETKVLQKRRKTIAGEEIGLLKPEEISNKALEKVRSEIFEDNLVSPRKSSRLSVKTDSARKRVEFQLKNNIAQEFDEYETKLVTNQKNPHNASKQPVQGVLKSTPEVNRIDPFYKFSEYSVKRNSRKSVI